MASWPMNMHHNASNNRIVIRVWKNSIPKLLEVIGQTKTKIF